MIIFGTRAFGKVDHVPGLFYVATHFFHIQFVPLLPISSYLFLDDGTERGVGIGLSGKSVLVAWLRAALLIGGVVAVILGIVHLGAARDEEKISCAVMLAGGGLLVALWWVSYRWTNAGLERAMELGEHLGIDPEIVREYFIVRIAPPADGIVQMDDSTPRDEP